MGLIIVGCSSALALAWRRRIEEQLPLTLTGIIAILYGFGIAGKLPWGINAVIVCSIVAWIFAVYQLWHLRAAGLQLLLTPGALLLMTVFLWLLLSFRVHTVHVWDDFSHWMLAAKNMVYYDTLPSVVEKSTVAYRSYPPGATLFEYLWTKLSGSFNEGDPQRGMNLLLLSFLIPAMRKQKWRSWFRALCTACALFLIPLAYNHVAYSSIYVDTLMGCVMLYGIYMWFSSERDAFAYVSIGCAVVLLPLLKSSGILLVFLMLAIIGIDLFLNRRSVCHKRIVRGFVVLILAAGLSALSWYVFLALNHVTDSMNSSSFSLTSLFNVLRGQGEEYQKATIHHFFVKLTEANVIANDSRLKPSVALIMAVYTGIVLLLTCLPSDDKDKKRRWLAGLWGLEAGMICYAGAILFTYLFFFMPHEARYLYSFGRYLCPMLIPMTGIALIALDELQGYRFGFLPALVAVISLLILPETASIANSTLWANEHAMQLQISLQKHVISSEDIQRLSPETDKVFLIASPEQGYDFFLNAYHISPVQTQPATWWISKDKTENWKEAVSGGNYTHLYSLVESFKPEEGLLIKAPDMIQKGILYQIQHYPEGICLSEATE